MRRFCFLFLISASLLMSGCHTTTIYIDGSPPFARDQNDTGSTESKQQNPGNEPYLGSKQSYYWSLFLGLYEFSDPEFVNCPNKVARIELQRSILDTVIHTVVGGIATPRHVNVYCKP